MDRPDRRQSEPTRLEAHATDSAVVNQAGRDLHVHHGPGVRRTRAASGSTVCPYPGLAAFEKSEAQWFFGRDGETAELLERLDQRASGGIQLVVAPSGAGKSSLLRAGLLPALAADLVPGSAEWTVRLRTPGTDPLASVDDPGDVLVLDQFEELFAVDRSVQDRVVARLAQLARSGTRIVLGLRADFYPNCTDFQLLRDALRDRPVLLGPMDDDQLRAAIRFPAQDVGLEVEDGLIELILVELDGDGSRQAGRLPLLAHALRACWRQRHGSTLTVDGYRATGGIERAIATTAEDTYATLDPPGQATARLLFTRLVRVGADTPDTRRQLVPGPLLAELGPPGESVLEAFTRQRLLTRAEASVEITHDALLRAWPRLTEWINRDRAGALLRQELHEDAEQWQRSERDPALLYRGSRLEAAREWAAVHPETVGTAAAAFLTSAHDAHRRSVGTRRRAVAALAVLAVVASAAAGVSLWLSSRYRAERDAVVATQLSAQADVVRAGDPSLAAQLDLAAYRRHRTARTALAIALDAGRPLATPLPGHWTEVAYSPDGRLLATVSADGPRAILRLWDNPPDRSPRPLSDPLDTGSGAIDPQTTSAVSALRFTPDHRSVIVAVHGRGARVWDVADPAHPIPTGGLVGEGFAPANTLTLSGDTRRMVTVGDTAQLWDTTDLARPALLATLPTASTAFPIEACFDNAERTAVIATSNGVERWDLSDPAHPAALSALPIDYGNSVLCRPGGGMIAVSGPRSGGVHLWDTRDPTHPAPLRADGFEGEAKAWSSDGHQLISNDAAGKLHRWDVTSSNPVELDTVDAGTDLLTAHLDPSGRGLVSIGDRIRRWVLPGPPDAVPGPVDDLVVGGRRLALATQSGVRLFDLHGSAPPTPVGNALPGTRAFDSLMLSPDGRWLVTRSFGPATLWDLGDPTRPRSVGPVATAIADTPAQAWVPSKPGARSLITCDDGGFRTWDMSRPEAPTALGHTPVSSLGCLALTSAGGRLAVRDLAGVQLFDVADPGHPVRVGPLLPTPFHPQAHPAFTLSPDGRYLAILGESGFQLWDVSDPAHPSTIGQPIDAVQADFGPELLITSNGVAGARLWDLDADRAADRVCAATSGVLTEASWPTYGGPDIDYEPTCP